MSAPKYPGWCESGRDGFPQCRRVELERKLKEIRKLWLEFQLDNHWKGAAWHRLNEALRDD